MLGATTLPPEPKPLLSLGNGPNPHDKYSTNLTKNDKSIDGVLGTRTWGGKMVGADKSIHYSVIPSL